MVILLYIFLGLLLFDCLLAGYLYFREDRPFEKDEDYSDYLKKVKLSE